MGAHKLATTLNGNTEGGKGRLAVVRVGIDSVCLDQGHKGLEDEVGRKDTSQGVNGTERKLKEINIFSCVQSRG